MYKHTHTCTCTHILCTYLEGVRRLFVDCCSAAHERNIVTTHKRRGRQQANCDGLLTPSVRQLAEGLVSNCAYSLISIPEHAIQLARLVVTTRRALGEAHNKVCQSTRRQKDTCTHVQQNIVLAMATRYQEQGWLRCSSTSAVLHRPIR